MKYVFGIAGVSAECFGAVIKNRSKIVENEDEVIGEVYAARNSSSFAGGHADFLIRTFALMIENDHHNDLRDTAFVIFYISSNPSAARFVDRFFPAILCVPIDWTLTGHNRTTWGASANDLLGKLRAAAQTVRQQMPSLKKELSERIGRTPWLLPVQNFRCDLLIASLAAIADRLGRGAGFGVSMEGATDQFQRKHPLRLIGTRRIRCFVDDARIEFHPPGKDRHAYARFAFGGHPPMCLIAGRRRLGAPYDRAFHYDCSRGDRRLRARLASCHEPVEMRKGTPHLNVAPNDFVRA